MFEMTAVQLYEVELDSCLRYSGPLFEMSRQLFEMGALTVVNYGSCIIVSGRGRTVV